MKVYFEIFGEVSDPIIMRDKDTRNLTEFNNDLMLVDTSRGFGFVTFKDPRVLDEVLQMTPHIIDGKQVILVFSIIHDKNIILAPPFSTSWIFITCFRLSAKEQCPKSKALNRCHKDPNIRHKSMQLIQKVNLICKTSNSRQQIYHKTLRFAVLRRTQFNNNRLIIKFIITILFRTKTCTPNNSMEHRIINNIILKIQATKLKVGELLQEISKLQLGIISLPIIHQDLGESESVKTKTTTTSMVSSRTCHCRRPLLQVRPSLKALKIQYRECLSKMPHKLTLRMIQLGK